MGLVRTFEEFVRALEQSSVPHRATAQAREVELPSNHDLPGGVIIKWETRVPFIGVRHALFEHVPADRMADLEAAIARINHHVEVAGFTLDHLRRRLYYRVSIPVFDGIDSDLVGRVAKGVIANATEFQTSFGAVIADRSGLEIAQIYKEVAHSRATAFG